MSRTRSSFLRRKLALESLEERWTPADVTSAAAWLNGIRVQLRSSTPTSVSTVAETPGTGTGTTTSSSTGMMPVGYQRTYLRNATPSTTVITGGGAVSGTTPSTGVMPVGYQRTYLRSTAPSTTVITGGGAVAGTTPSTGMMPAGYQRVYLRSNTPSTTVITGGAASTIASSLPPAVSGSVSNSATVAVAPASTTTSSQVQTSVTTPSTGSTVVPTTLPPSVSGDLAALYKKASDPTQPVSPTLNVVDGNVGVSISGTAGGDFNTLVTSLRNLGMQVQSTNPAMQAIRGMLPISQIPTAAAIPQVMSMSALRKPTLG